MAETFGVRYQTTNGVGQWSRNCAAIFHVWRIRSTTNGSETGREEGYSFFLPVVKEEERKEAE